MIIVLLQLIKYSVTTLSKCLSILIRYKTIQFIWRFAGLWPAVVHMWSCQHTHTCMGRANKSNSKQQLVIDRLMQVNNSKSKPVWYYSCAPFKTIFNLAINTLVGDAQSTQACRGCWSCTPLYVIDPARLDPIRPGPNCYDPNPIRPEFSLARCTTRIYTFRFLPVSKDFTTIEKLSTKM